MKKFLCWLLGHKMVPITDKDEIHKRLHAWRFQGAGLPVMVMCSRCGCDIK